MRWMSRFLLVIVPVPELTLQRPSIAWEPLTVTTAIEQNVNWPFAGVTEKTLMESAIWTVPANTEKVMVVLFVWLAAFEDQKTV